MGDYPRVIDQVTASVSDVFRVTEAKSFAANTAVASALYSIAISTGLVSSEAVKVSKMSIFAPVPLCTAAVVVTESAVLGVNPLSA